MSTLSEEELSRRLGSIIRGPWSAGVTEASSKLAPIDKLSVSTDGASPIEIDKIHVSRKNKQKDKRLTTVLRSHFEDEEGITNPREIQTREALDEALTLPQLFELAVQTGYLPLDAVRLPSRKILTDLLWSGAARSFVNAYDYVAVPMLASRVGIFGLGAVKAPQPNEKAALRFAGFLAHFRAFWEDEQIQVWTRFLDDYIEEEDEQNKLWDYLTEKRKTGPKRTQTLLAGCQQFVASIASAFHVLDDDELGHFGLVHAYWLQKFFGYELDKSGYVRDVDLWGAKDSWARAVTTSPRMVSAELDSEIAEVYREQLSNGVRLLERTFKAVRALKK